MAIEWKEIYSVNVKQIDEQHQKIFDLMNRLKFLEEKDKNKEEVLTVLKEIEDYSIYHFETEEDYFDKTKYPEKDFHLKQHEAYKQKIEKMKKQAGRNTDKEIIEEMFQFLQNWWINHILKVDMEYSDFLNQHGVF